MKEFGDVEVEGFKRTGGKKKFRARKLIRIEEDGSKTTAYTLEINGEKTFAIGFQLLGKGTLPESFTNNQELMQLWGQDGSLAVNKARRMQNSWEQFGQVVDPQDLNHHSLRHHHNHHYILLHNHYQIDMFHHL